MATLSDSVKAQLDADWTAAGGAEPTYYVEEDIRVAPPAGQDWVLIRTSSLSSDAQPVNDTYINERHTLVLVVNTLTSEDRLKELSDEVVRILDATTVANITYQRRLKRQIVSGIDKGVFYYQEEITYDLREQMKSSAAAYGTGTTGDFVSVGDIRVGGDDIKDSSGAVVISFDGAGAIDQLGPNGLTGAYLEDLLMFGSANAAWMPCSFEYPSTSTAVTTFAGMIINAGAADFYGIWKCGLPTVKGSLKLYVNGVKVSLAQADATDYVTATTVYGLDSTNATGTVLYTDGTNLQSADSFESDDEMVAWGAADDCSGHDSVSVQLQTTVATAGELRIAAVSVQAYYDT